MKTKVIVEVNGVEYTIVSYESEEYVREVAAEVSKRISAIQLKTMRSTKVDAAILTALDFCDENKKLQENNDNMRQQIVGYIDEISTLNKKMSALEKKLKLLVPEEELEEGEV